MPKTQVGTIENSKEQLFILHMCPPHLLQRPSSSPLTSSGELVGKDLRADTSSIEEILCCQSDRCGLSWVKIHLSTDCKGDEVLLSLLYE